MEIFLKLHVFAETLQFFIRVRSRSTVYVRHPVLISARSLAVVSCEIKRVLDLFEAKVATDST